MEREKKIKLISLSHHLILSSHHLPSHFSTYHLIILPSHPSSLNLPPHNLPSHISSFYRSEALTTAQMFIDAATDGRDAGENKRRREMRWGLIMRRLMWDGWWLIVSSHIIICLIIYHLISHQSIIFFFSDTPILRTTAGNEPKLFRWGGDGRWWWLIVRQIIYHEMVDKWERNYIIKPSHHLSHLYHLIIIIVNISWDGIQKWQKRTGEREREMVDDGWWKDMIYYSLSHFTIIIYHHLMINHLISLLLSSQLS